MESVPRVAEEVRQALHKGRPVVALESTIIAHGFPRPRNLELAVQFERTLAERGVLPATVAIIDGTPRVGLNPAELTRLAEDPAVVKASTRDLPVTMCQGRTAATTVASTALLAARAGIRVFATGGLGGVHRDVQWSASTARRRRFARCSGRLISPWPRGRSWKPFELGTCRAATSWRRQCS